jgi:predicted phosphodiesterase
MSVSKSIQITQSKQDKEADNKLRRAGIQVKRIQVPITSDELVLCVHGDYHYGVRGVDLDEGRQELAREHKQHQGSIFDIITGDLLENHINGSIGHGYDLEIRDPAEQKEGVGRFLKDVGSMLYGKNLKKISDELPGSTVGVLAGGVVGNHEYRSRKVSGQWILSDIYKEAGILDLGISCLLIMQVINKTTKRMKEYKIFVSHRPSSTETTSVEGILRSCKRRKSDVSADIYVYGHAHRRLIEPDVKYGEDGVPRKVLYVINPSPVHDMEYASWAGYSPMLRAWYVNVMLPIDGREPYGWV